MRIRGKGVQKLIETALKCFGVKENGELKGSQ